MAPTWQPLSGPAHAIALDVLIHGPRARAELARRHDLSAGSLTRLTKPLVDSGLLVEQEDPRPSENRIGRPQQPLDIVEDSHHFIGVKLTGDTAYAVLTTLRARIVATQERRFDDTSPAGVVRTVTALARQLAQSVHVTAIGISLGGHAADRRVVTAAPFLEWSDVPLARLVQEATGIDTVVENDLVALTEAEHWFGAGTGRSRFAVLTIGAGVGYGLVVQGHLVAGPDAGLGLVGHVPLDPTGPLCFAGHRGCSTAMLTMPSIAATASVALRRTVSYDDVLDLAVGGDPAARRVVTDSGRALGRLVALVGNFTMPECIVLAGEGVRLAEVAGAAVAEAMLADRDPAASPLRLEPRPGDFLQWARGAAVIAIQTYVLGTD